MAINLNKESLKELSNKEEKKSPKRVKKAAEPSDKKAVINNENEKRHVEKVAATREVKWVYPEDCTDTLSRKKFRQKSRDAIRKLERDIRALTESGKDEKKLKSLTKELTSERKRLLHQPNDAV